MRLFLLVFGVAVSFSSLAFDKFPAEMIVTTSPGNPPLKIEVPRLEISSLGYADKATNCRNLSFGFNVDTIWKINGQELNVVNVDADQDPEIHCGDVPPKPMSWDKRVAMMFVSLQSKSNPAYWLNIEYFRSGHHIKLFTGFVATSGDWRRPSPYSEIYWSKEPLGHGYVRSFRNLD